MKRKRRRLSNVEYVLLLRRKAEEEAQAKAESADRQERIEVLWQELQKELDRARELAKGDLGKTLLELVGLQREEISCMLLDHRLYQWAKTPAPEEVAAIREKYHSVVRAVLEGVNKLTPRQAYEHRSRSRGPRNEVGLIEHEFGGEAEARGDFLHNPTCLDAILMGDGVTGWYLEILFGMERHRFPEKLPGVRDGRKILYGAFALAKIMDALLGEKLPKRKSKKRGGSERKLWLGNPDSRKRVLMGIANRAVAYSRDKEILAEFMAVVCPHLGRGYPSEQLPEGWEELARLGRCFLD